MLPATEPSPRLQRQGLIQCLSVLLLVLIGPRPALANAGTPLMWAGLFHLLVGNLVIGLIEAAVLSLTCRVRFAPVAGWVVLGNYVAW